MRKDVTGGDAIHLHIPTPSHIPAQWRTLTLGLDTTVRGLGLAPGGKQTLNEMLMAPPVFILLYKLFSLQICGLMILICQEGCQQWMYRINLVFILPLCRLYLTFHIHDLDLWT